MAKTHPRLTVHHGFTGALLRVAQVDAILPVQIPCGFLADLMEAKQSTGDVCCIFSREIKGTKYLPAIVEVENRSILPYFHVDFRPPTYGGNVFHPFAS